jgi:DNA-binding beta-propeller fold protein YncE
MIVGEGKYRFELVENWAQLPDGWLLGDAPGVATDSDDRVYVFNRSEHPVMVFDRDGRFEGSWGEGVFARAHGITITSDGFVYCTDDMDHTVRKFTLQGKLLQTIGTPHQASDTGYVAGEKYSLTAIRRSAGPFNRPTKVAKAPNGELFITDGYGNARVHRFSAEGDHILSWGEPGEGQGQFNLPHSIWILEDGRVLVCDRENSRVQIFNQDGALLGSWDNIPRPQELYVEKNSIIFVASRFCKTGEMTMAGKPMSETCPPHISVRDMDGNELTRWGGLDPHQPGGLAGAHGIWQDTRGDLYVVEVAETALNQTGQYRTGRVPIHKYARV